MRCSHWLSLIALSGAASFGLLAARVPAAAAVAEEPQPGTFQIDGVHSSLLFRIRHMGVSYFYGRFNSMKGELVLDDDPGSCRVFVDVEAKSVDTGNGRRDDHLRGPDFFNAAEFPSIVFESTKVERKGEVYEVTGNLDLHGVSNEVTIPMQLVGARDVGAQGGGYRVGFEGRVTIDRTDYGVGASGGLGDEVEIIVSFAAARKS